MSETHSGSSTGAKVAVVTGASSGIGRATAIALYAAGWTVVVNARRREALEETVSLMREGGALEGRAMVVVGDVSKEEDVRRVFTEVKERYGRLDLLFNNAGVHAPKRPIEELGIDDIRSVFDTNILGPVLCAQEAIKMMKSQNPRGGRIINNGSVSAFVPRPVSVPYTMSKHAITGLTKSIALDYREDRIACSQLDIGNAQSDMSAYKPVGILQADGSIRPEPVMDVSYSAAAVVYMASLPLEVNVLNQTLMATNMPLVGRG